MCVFYNMESVITFIPIVAVTIGAILGASVTYLYGRAQTRRQNTFLLSSEFNTDEMLKSRLAALTVDFFCRKAHLSIEPKGLLTIFCGLEQGEWKLNNLASVRSWQILLGLDKFNLTLQIADYWFVAADKKVEFEKLLRKTSRKFKIES